MDHKLLYFTYRGKGFIYSEPSNTILEVSEKVGTYFLSGLIDNEDTFLKDELAFFTTQQDNYSYLPKEYLFNNPSRDLIESTITRVQSSNQNSFFIIQLDGPLQTIDYLQLFCETESHKIKYAVRQNIRYIFERELADSFMNHKIELAYYSDIDSFEKLVKSSKIKERIFIQVRLKSQRDFLKYTDLEVPQNFVVSFRVDNHDLKGEVFSLLANKIENYFKNRTHNISNYFDIVRLMRYNFGKQFNKIYNLGTDNSTDQVIHCNNCWARKVCHQTRLFGIFSESPFITQQRVENCNSIRGFTEDYLKALLLFKDLKNKEMLPVFLEKSGFKLKLINP